MPLKADYVWDYFFTFRRQQQSLGAYSLHAFWQYLPKRMYTRLADRDHFQVPGQILPEV